MPKIENIVSWLSEKTYHIENCKDTCVNVGTLTNFIQLEQKHGKPDPLTIRLNYQSVHRKREESNLRFRINDDEKYILQFIKRIEYTPFYYSYITGKDFSIDLVDFYYWIHPITHYRIFVIQHYDKDPEIKLYYSLHDTSIQENNQIKHKDWTLHSSVKLSWHEFERCCVFKQSSKNSYQNVIIFALQWDEHNQVDLSPDSVFSHLQTLETKSRENHIRNVLIINNSSSNRDLDHLWMKQKLFTPERGLDYVLSQCLSEYDIALTWIIELALSVGWHDILVKILKMLKIENKKKTTRPRLIYWEYFLESFFNPDADHHSAKTIDLKPEHVREAQNANDPFVNLLYMRKQAIDSVKSVSDDYFIYQAYFTNKISEYGIVTSIQFWWNIYSQPLFSRRFEEDLKQKPEKMFILYLLALKMNLPWAEYLYENCHQFNNNEIFQLIAFLKQRLYTRYENKERISVFPENLWDNNRKRMELGSQQLAISITKYGKKKYTTLKQQKRTIFRIDREVRLLFDMRQQDITMIPSVVNIFSKLPTTIVLGIEVANIRLWLPLSWRQGEVFLAGLRFRWVFKKRRFQFTVTRKNNIDRFLINGQSYVFDNSYKTKFYINITKKLPQIHLQLLDQYGRSMHQEIHSYRRVILLSGYCKDSFGLFMEHFNYKYNSQNRPIEIDSSGNILQKIELPSNREQLTFQIKNYKKRFDLMIFKDKDIENILRFSPHKWFTDFNVLIDKALITKLAEINLFFERYFFFRPHYRIKTDDLKNQFGRNILYICSNHSVIKVKSDKKLSSYPIFEVGIKDGLDTLEDLYGILIEPFKKMKMEADSA